MVRFMQKHPEPVGLLGALLLLAYVLALAAGHILTDWAKTK